MSFPLLSPPFCSGFVRSRRKAANETSKIMTSKGAGALADRAFIPRDWDVTLFDTCISVLTGMLRLMKPC